MDYWPDLERRRLIDIASGTLVFFEYKSTNYYAMVIEPMRNGDVPSLLCVYPKHPAVESAGLLSASVIGGGGSEVILVSRTRAVVKDPLNSLTCEYGYIAAGSLSFQYGELAITAYVDDRSKGAFSLREGRHLGEAMPTDYFREWQIEALHGQSSIVLATIVARPRLPQ